MVRTESTESACTIRPVVIAPTFNNAGTLLDVLARIERVGVPIIVVNDGSSDGTADDLCNWQAAKHATPVWVETHPRNRGKEAALRTGFAKAEAEGFSHAVTIDTDGQLDPEQIPDLLREAGDNPNALVLGRRSDLLAGLPRANRLAWWLSALGIWLNTGRRVPDSQCGLRVYPLALLRVIRCRSRRYGFETESVIRTAWSGAALVEVPVECHYPPKPERVSHFNVWLDGPHSFFMQAGLTIRRLIPWPHRRIASPADRKSTSAFRSAGRELLDWINPMSLWRQLRRDRLQQLIVAGAFGIGTFMANMPFGWPRFLLGVYASRRLNVHLLPILIGLCLMAARPSDFLARAALGIGHLIFHASWLDIATATGESSDRWTLVTSYPFAFTIGCVITGFVCNWVAIGVLFPIFRFIAVNGAADATSRSPKLRVACGRSSDNFQ